MKIILTVLTMFLALLAGASYAGSESYGTSAAAGGSAGLGFSATFGPGFAVQGSQSGQESGAFNNGSASENDWHLHGPVHGSGSNAQSNNQSGQFSGGNQSNYGFASPNGVAGGGSGFAGGGFGSGYSGAWN